MADKTDQNDPVSEPSTAAATPANASQGAVQFDIGAYSLVQPLGKGAHSHVWRAYSTRSYKYVAIKCLIAETETPVLAIRVLREAKILRLLRGHDDIVRFHGFLTPPHPGSFRDMLMVFEVVPKSLRRILRKKPILKPKEVNALMFQLVRGVRFMHASKVLHRDLKPENLLVDPATGNLKICDFGLARVAFEPSPIVTWADVQLWTTRVATLWYRAPELLAMESSQTFYNSAIDVWAMGCIFGEMMLGRPLFECENEEDLMFHIIRFTGMPSEDTITRLGSKRAKDLVKFYGKTAPAVGFTLFPENTDKRALHLVMRMLRFDPLKRPSAAELLQDEYFSHWLKREGYGKEPVTINAEEFAFDTTFGDKERLELGEMFDDVMGEVERSRDATEGNAPVEIRQTRSLAILRSMEGGRPDHDMSRGTEPSPSPDQAARRQKYERMKQVATMPD